MAPLVFLLGGFGEPLPQCRDRSKRGIKEKQTEAGQCKSRDDDLEDEEGDDCGVWS